MPWVSTPASVRVALPCGCDVCIRRRCRARRDDCVCMAVRTRISPRCSKNRAFCIDESVLSGPIQDSASNNWIGRVCLPRSVLPVELSEIPRVVSFYAISPKSGLPHPNPWIGESGRMLVRVEWLGCGSKGVHSDRALRLDCSMPGRRDGGVLRQRLDVGAGNPWPKRQHKESRPKAACEVGADDGVRTRDPDLGKVVLYQLSHVRIARRYITRTPDALQELS